MAKLKNNEIEYNYEEENYQPIYESQAEELSVASEGLYTESETQESVANASEPNQLADAEVKMSVLKPIGGGAVPITPPSPIIQLQPIVVPIAIVPYAAQNQKLLQYDNNGQAINPATTPTAPQSTNNEEVFTPQYYGQKSNAVPASASANRGRSALILILSLLFLVPFLIAYFKADLIPSLILSDLNVIGKTLSYIGGVQFILTGEIPYLMLTVAFGFVAICVILSLVTLFAGKYSKIGTLVLSLFPALLSIGIVIYAFVPTFGLLAVNKIVYIIPAAIGLLQAIIAIAFAVGKKIPQNGNINQRVSGVI
ncbi:MAG: hypothetical protein PHE93_02670 [Clostridia bacterium]|nr:hypothetical protein [Clostridia bacterium]